MKFDYRNKVSFILAIILLVSGLFAEAHIKNEGSQFPDIEFSDAQFEIVLLVGAGIIPETPVFEPDLPLSRVDLAVWATLAEGLAEGGETPDIKALSGKALKQGLLDSLQGDATYEDINQVLFKGQLNPESPDTVPSKAEAASFVATNLTSGTAGNTLLDRRGMKTGPTGEVSAVESRMNPDGGSSYYITVAGETYPLYSHGRVANGPTDLIQWKGREVRRSFLKQFGDLTLWVYLEAEPIQVVAPTGNAISGVINDSVEAESRIPANNNLLYGLMAAVLVLGVILFFKSKRS